MSAAEAARDAEAAATLARAVAGRGWVAAELRGGSLPALAEPMRPVDRLRPVHFVAPVVPLQGVIDRMAGSAAAIQTYTGAWRQVATGVAEVRRQLDRTTQVPALEWTGDAAARYRERVSVLLSAMAGTASLANAMADAATAMGEAAAAARSNAHRQLDDLVGRLVDYLTRARAAEGGYTANVMSSAMQMINEAAPRLAVQEQALLRTVDAFEKELSANGFGPQWTKVREWYVARVAGAPKPGAPAAPGRNDRGPQGRGGAYLDGDRILLRPRDPGVPDVEIPNNVGAKGFVVGSASNLLEWAHTYKVPRDTAIPFQGNETLIADAIARNPVPMFDDQPASATGSRNNALPGQYVNSYRIPSPDPSRFTDVIVNYTIAGEHMLEEGYVIRYGERDANGNTRLVTYGEGNAWEQHPANLLNTAGVQAAWTLNNGNIAADIQQRVGRTQPAR